MIIGAITAVVPLGALSMVIMDWFLSPEIPAALPLLAELSSLALLVFLLGGGVCSLIRKHWWWALSGAISAIIVVVSGLSSSTSVVYSIPRCIH